MKKIDLNFPLHNKLFYYGSIFSMVLIVVISNNYFFYRNKDIVLKHQLDDSAVLIGKVYETCLESRPKDDCQAELVKPISATWDFGRISILDSQKKEILNVDKESYKDQRIPIVHTALAGSGDNQIAIFISKLSSPPLHVSVFKSMTLSITDLIASMRDGGDVLKTLTTVAIPRSSSAIYALIVIWFIMNFARATDKARRRYADILEKKLETRTNELQTVIVKKDSVESELGNLRKLAENEGKENKELWSELELKEKELKNHIEEEQRLIAQIREQEKLVLENANKNDPSDKTVEKVLLSNPDIKKGQAPFTYHLGKPHHGTDWVAGVCESLLKDPIGSKLISRASGSDNGPRLRGKAILEWNAQNKEFILTAYNADYDAGYAILLALNAKSLVEAIMISKYILNVSKGKLRNTYQFEVHRNAYV